MTMQESTIYLLSIFKKKSCPEGKIEHLTFNYVTFLSLCCTKSSNFHGFVALRGFIFILSLMEDIRHPIKIILEVIIFLFETYALCKDLGYPTHTELV